MDQDQLNYQINKCCDVNLCCDVSNDVYNDVYNDVSNDVPNSEEKEPPINEKDLKRRKIIEKIFDNRKFNKIIKLAYYSKKIMNAGGTCAHNFNLILNYLQNILIIIFSSLDLFYSKEEETEIRNNITIPLSEKIYNFVENYNGNLMYVELNKFIKLLLIEVVNTKWRCYTCFHIHNNGYCNFVCPKCSYNLYANVFDKVKYIILPKSIENMNTVMEIVGFKCSVCGYLSLHKINPQRIIEFIRTGTSFCDKILFILENYYCDLYLNEYNTITDFELNNPKKRFLKL
jgi:hypothetical protein